jgi:hypothetical protein
MQQYSPIEEPGVAGDSEVRVVLVVVTGRRSFDEDLRGRRRRNRRPGYKTDLSQIDQKIKHSTE